MRATAFLLLPFAGPPSAEAHVGVLALTAPARTALTAALRSLEPGDTTTLAADSPLVPACAVLTAPRVVRDEPSSFDGPLAQVVDGQAPALLVLAYDRALFLERVDAWGGAAESMPGRTCTLTRSADGVQWAVVDPDGTRYASFVLPLPWLQVLRAHAAAYEDLHVEKDALV